MSAPQFTPVPFGDVTVPVLKGGYYDRFHAAPNLEAVAEDPAAGNLDFFRRFPKQRLASRVGPVWAPNFYYRAKTAQLLFLAPMSQLRRALPDPLEPLHALPGYGLVALSLFRYDLCDNDPYNEVSVAVVIRVPGSRGSHLRELRASMQRDRFHAHVLALPVDTEIARVRGVEAYQLPKWRTEIALSFDETLELNLTNAAGGTDLSLSSPIPPQQDLAPQSRIGTSVMVNRIDGRWHRTTVHTNKLRLGQKLLPRDISLGFGTGAVSQLLKALGVGRLLRMDVMTDGQLVLNLPIPANE